MHRLAAFDIAAHHPTGLPKLAAQTAFGIACTGLFVASRVLIDAAAPGVAPFALMFPCILIAALYGHWRAGLVTLTLSTAWGWYAVILPPMSWQIAAFEDKVRLALSFVSGGVLVFLAEGFRRAVRDAASARDRQIAYSELLRRELDHRTKNNLQLMHSLLHLQLREEANDEAKAALSLALRRLSSFTSVYSRFPTDGLDVQRVSVRPYLEQLVEEVAGAIFGNAVSVTIECADIELPRETALAIGLYVNEALTNCAKYAFNDDPTGTVKVTLDGTASRWILEVVDSGAGDGHVPPTSGMGTALMEAFAQQANAVHQKYYPDQGCAVRLVGLS